MNAESLLSKLQKHGVTITANGENLRIEAAAGVLTDDDRTLIRENKAKLLALLSKPANDTNAAATLCECESERAAIQEFDGGLSRAEAEAATRQYRHVRCRDCRHLNGTPQCAAGLTTSHPAHPRLCGVHFRQRGTSEGRAMARLSDNLAPPDAGEGQGSVTTLREQRVHNTLKQNKGSSRTLKQDKPSQRRLTGGAR